MINKFIIKTTKLFLCLTVLALAFNSCKKTFEYDLPDANSIEDAIPPSANFSYASTLEDFKTIKFTNLSEEATTYEWNFGDGNTSSEKDPTFTFDAGEGTYSVMLTASDALGKSDEIIIEVMVMEGPFQPIILEPGFEDNSLPDGSGDGRDSWRANSWNTIFGISSSPVTFGSQAAKMEVSSARGGYQEIVVEANTNYDLRFWYTMKDDSSDPWAIVSIVGVTQFGPIESQQEAFDGTIASITVNDTSEPETYVEQKFSFNSGDNNTIAIYFYNNANVEARFDDFSIEVGAEGAVPPSAGFDVEQSSADFLAYTFTNTSTNADSYAWDFGDGNTSTDESPNHTYATADVYTVKLEVRSAAGLTASLEKTVDIQAPVTAAFTFEADAADYKTINFTDGSMGAVSLLWEFGDGFQFTGMNPSHTYMDDGPYTVTLTATSITGSTSTATEDIIVAQGFIAVINDPGVEDGSGAWRNNDLEADADMVFGDGTWVTQTSSTSHTGSGSAKLPTIESNGGDQFSSRRWIYQAIEVEANTDYDIDFWIRNKDSDAGTTVTVQIYDAPFNEVSVIDNAANILSTEILNAASGHDNNSWTEAKINFNSGSSTMIVLYIYNDWTLNVTGGDDESESYLDDFTITKL